MPGMEIGDRVMVLGVRSRTRVECSDAACEYEHFDHLQGWGRYHYEDGPREGMPGVVVGFEPPVWPSDQPKVVARTADGAVVSVDAADVEAASKGSAHFDVIEAVIAGG